MKLKTYKATTHDGHVDVELNFLGQPPIKLCNCTLYNGFLGAFGNAQEIAPAARQDLATIANSGTNVIVCRDINDDSIDILSADDRTLLFSMEADRTEGAGWVPTYEP